MVWQDDPSPVSISPDRLKKLRVQQVRNARIALALFAPMMLYVTYQVYTRQPVVDKPLSFQPEADARDVFESGPARKPAIGSNGTRPSLPSSDLAAGEKIDPNTATWSELTVLPGIGEVTAKKIVAYREDHLPAEGPVFRCAADLDAVSGIGPKTIEKIAPYLSIPASCHEAGLESVEP